MELDSKSQLICHSIHSLEQQPVVIITAFTFYHSHSKPNVILVVTSATAQGKQIKAVPLTMAHVPSYHGHFKPDVILVVTSATAQGKQIKAVPLTMVHAPSHLPASSCRITKHLTTLHIISHSPRMPLSSDHLPTTDLSLSLMMIQASIRPSLHISLPSY